jgi:uncharacterized membrane protein YfcA
VTPPRWVNTAVLAASDGLVSLSGVVAGALAAGATEHTAGILDASGALSAAVSMAGAQYLSEGHTDWRLVYAMGGGTITGAALPGIPLLVIPGQLGWIIAVTLALVVAGVVGEVRSRITHLKRPRAYLSTGIVLGLGVGVGIAAALALKEVTLTG